MVCSSLRPEPVAGGFPPALTLRHWRAAETHLLSMQAAPSERWVGLEPGSDPAELARQAWALVHPDDRPVLVQAWHDAMATGAPRRVSLRLVMAGDDERLFHLIFTADPAGTTGVAIELTGWKRDQDVLVTQHRLLHRIAGDEPLPVALDDLCRFIEQTLPGSRCTVLLLDPATRTLRYGAAPTIACGYMEALEGTVVGPEVGSCGTAVHFGTPVISPDVRVDPKWAAFRHLADEYRLGACWSVPFFDRDGRAAGTLAVYFESPRDADAGSLAILDTTARLASVATQRVKAREDLERAQAELQQAARLEAVGHLAGGVAHDFNNILTVIQGAAGALSETLPPGSPARADAELILAAAQRGATLTGQLLAFGRRQLWRPTRVDLNQMMSRVVQLLRYSVRADVKLTMRPAPRLTPLWADEGQLEQVMVNLVLNACEAMPGGGTVELATGSRVEEGGFDGLPGPVEVVSLSIRDEGVGMDAATRQHIFEPFFTTKGKGHGLGLASVYGIVRRAQGTVQVHSQPGAGSTFVVELPVMPAPRAEAEATAGPSGVTARRRSGQVVVLAEDDPLVRTTTARQLRGRGFEVVECENGQRALEALVARDGQVSLVLTDVVMPEMGGPALEHAVRERWPTLPVVLMSGYTDDLAALRESTRAGRGFLAKPFTVDELLREMERGLDVVRPASTAAT